MRGLRRLILLFFVLIVGVPLALGGAALIKDATPPDYLVNFDDSFKTEEVMMKKLNTIALSNMLGESSIYIDEVTVNKMIYQNANGFEDAYFEISPGQIVSVDYVWTTFDDNELSIYVLFSYQQIQTTMTLKLGFSEAEDGVKITLNQFKVGQLLYPKPVLSYAIKLLEQYGEINLKDEYSYGDLNYKDLYVTVDEEHIQELIDDSLGNDLIMFDSISLDNGKLFLNYNFNTEGNPEAEAIHTTVTNLNSILKDDTRKTKLTGDVSSKLNLTNEKDKAFNDSFNEVIVLLSDKVTNTENMTELTDEDEAKLTAMGETYAQLDETTQAEIAVALEENIDPDKNIEAALEALGVEGYDNIADLLVGGGQ